MKGSSFNLEKNFSDILSYRKLWQIKKIFLILDEIIDVYISAQQQSNLSRKMSHQTGIKGDYIDDYIRFLLYIISLPFSITKINCNGFVCKDILSVIVNNVVIRF